jgi:hypothetical protein
LREFGNVDSTWSVSHLQLSLLSHDRRFVWNALLMSERIIGFF